jgi:hypothetical protein
MYRHTVLKIYGGRKGLKRAFIIRSAYGKNPDAILKEYVNRAYNPKLHKMNDLYDATFGAFVRDNGLEACNFTIEILRHFKKLEDANKFLNKKVSDWHYCDLSLNMRSRTEDVQFLHGAILFKVQKFAFVSRGITPIKKIAQNLIWGAYHEKCHYYKTPAGVFIRDNNIVLNDPNIVLYEAKCGEKHKEDNSGKLKEALQNIGFTLLNTF